MKAKSPLLDANNSPVCINFNIRKASRAVSQHFDNIMQPTGLRGTQFSILGILTLKGVVNICDLAEAMVMDRTTLTRNLKPLEKNGLLTICAGQEDRRVREIHLTDEGRETFKTALPYWRTAQKSLVGQVGEDVLHALISNLGSVVQASSKLKQD